MGRGGPLLVQVQPDVLHGEPLQIHAQGEGRKTGKLFSRRGGFLGFGGTGQLQKGLKIPDPVPGDQGHLRPVHQHLVDHQIPLDQLGQVVIQAEFLDVQHPGGFPQAHLGDAGPAEQAEIQRPHGDGHAEAPGQFLFDQGPDFFAGKIIVQKDGRDRQQNRSDQSQIKPGPKEPAQPGPLTPRGPRRLVLRFLRRRLRRFCLCSTGVGRWVRFHA